MERRLSESRTPAPIFTIKRPRQALLAHPGNSFVADENAYPGHGFTSSVLTRVQQQPAVVQRTTEIKNNLPQLLQPLPKGYAPPIHHPTLADPYPVNSKVSRSFDNSGLNSCQQRFQNVGIWSPSNMPRTSHPERQLSVSQQSTNPKCSLIAVPRPMSMPVSSMPLSTSTMNNVRQNNLMQSNVRASALLSSTISSSGFNKRSLSVVNSSSLPRNGGQSEQQGMLGCPQQAMTSQSFDIGNQNKRCLPVVNNDVTKSVTSASTMSRIETKQSQFTLRFITSSVHDMKQWSECKIKLSVLFEVIGILNSAVAGDLMSNQCVTFLLKDVTGCVNCTFHQIDRQLPRLTRGQWYRCVGHYDASTHNSMKCVSVRLASDAEKRNRETLIATSRRALQEWMHSTSET